MAPERLPQDPVREVRVQVALTGVSNRAVRYPFAVAGGSEVLVEASDAEAVLDRGRARQARVVVGEVEQRHRSGDVRASVGGRDVALDRVAEADRAAVDPQREQGRREGLGNRADLEESGGAGWPRRSGPGLPVALDQTRLLVDRPHADPQHLVPVAAVDRVERARHGACRWRGRRRSRAGGLARVEGTVARSAPAQGREDQRRRDRDRAANPCSRCRTHGAHRSRGGCPR